MVLVLNVIPNIIDNAGAVARILKCTAEGFTRTLLNATEPFNRAKKDLVEEAIKAWRDDLSIVNHLRHLDHYTHIDVSEVKSMFGYLIGQIEANFSHAMNLLKEYKLWSSRILAAIYVVLLIVESAHYLKSYLTSVRFDNSFISKAVRQKTSEDSKKKNVLICKITSQECTSCFVSLVVVTIYFLAMTLIIVLDHIVYYLVQMILPWVMDFPPTTASISVNYEVRRHTVRTY